MVFLGGRRVLELIKHPLGASTLCAGAQGRHGRSSSGHGGSTRRSPTGDPHWHPRLRAHSVFKLCACAAHGAGWAQVPRLRPQVGVDMIRGRVGGGGGCASTTTTATADLERQHEGHRCTNDCAKQEG